MSDIQIILNSPQSTYCPGDKLEGYVLVNLPKDKKVDKIRLQAKGQAHVSFHEGLGETAIYYNNDEIYFDDYLTLWEKKSKNDKCLSSGSKHYPFSLTIPSAIAPSFEGTHGYIWYKLKAELDLPWALDKHCELEIPVTIPIDLNSDPKFTQPQSTSIHKSSILSSSKYLEAKISIPRLAWTADETIPIKCNVKNNSSHDVTAIEITIIQKENFTGKADFLYYNTNTNKCIKKVQSTKIDVQIPSSTSKEVKVYVEVPSNLVTINNCPIIKVDYELEIKLHSNKIFSSAPHTSLPIIISNVPLIHASASLEVPAVGFEHLFGFPKLYSSVTLITEGNDLPSYMPMPQSIEHPSA